MNVSPSLTRESDNSNFLCWSFSIFSWIVSFAINLLEDRNATSHLYSEQIANEIAHRIVTDYVEVIGKLIEKLDELI